MNVNVTELLKKKLVIYGLITVGLLLACLLFIYLPLQSKNNQLKAELMSFQKEIRQIESMKGPGQTVEEAIRQLEDEYRGIFARFPTKEEEALKHLAELAKQANIEVVSVKSQPRAPLLSEAHQKVQAEGKTFQTIAISMEVKGLFKDAVRYLESVKETLPAYSSVETLKIKKTVPGNPSLSVVIDLMIYVLS